MQLAAALAQRDLTAFERGATLAVIAPPAGRARGDPHAVEIAATFADA